MGEELFICQQVGKRSESAVCWPSPRRPLMTGGRTLRLELLVEALNSLGIGLVGKGDDVFLGS